MNRREKKEKRNMTAKQRNGKKNKMKGREWKFQERKRILKSQRQKSERKRKKMFENQIESEQCITNEKSL